MTIRPSAHLILTALTSYEQHIRTLNSLASSRIQNRLPILFSMSIVELMSYASPVICICASDLDIEVLRNNHVYFLYPVILIFHSSDEHMRMIRKEVRRLVSLTQACEVEIQHVSVVCQDVNTS